MGNTKLANPAPLGLMGFGMTTILLNLANSGLFAFDVAILGLWGVFTLFMFFGTLKAARMLQFVFLSLTVLFALLAIGHLADNEGLVKIAGWIGLVCGGSAIYLAMGEVLNEQFGRTVLPIGAPH